MSLQIFKRSNNYVDINESEGNDIKQSKMELKITMMKMTLVIVNSGKKILFN
jgi:hypothetical protein